MTHCEVYGTASTDSVDESLNVFKTYAMEESPPDHDTEERVKKLNTDLKLSFKQKSLSQNDVRMTPTPNSERKEFGEGQGKPRRQTVQGPVKIKDTAMQQKSNMRRSYSAEDLQPKSTLERLAFWKWFKPWNLFSNKKNSRRGSSGGSGIKRSQSARTTQTNAKLSADSVGKLERRTPQLASDVRLLKQEGSYYAISKEDAEKLLQRYEIGTYLVRPNSACDNFCLSYVVHLDKVEHANITGKTKGREGETGHVTTGASETFELVGKSKTEFNSLLDVVNMGRNKGFQVISATKSRLTFFLDSPPMEMALRPQYRNN